MSGAISAISAAGATAAAAGAGEAGIAGAALGANVGAIGTIASLGSAGVSALGSVSQSRANSAAAGYQSAVAAQNAQLQTETANREGAVGNEQASIKGVQTRAALATTLANQGASGVDVNTGSSVDVRESQAKLGMLDMQTIKSDAAWKAYGGQVNAASDTTNSQLLKSQQEYDTTSGYVNAGTTVLGGVGQASMYSKWLAGSGSVPINYGTNTD